MELFGYEISRKFKDEVNKLPAFAPEDKDDAAVIVNSAAAFNTVVLDMEGSVKTEADLITKYRQMSVQAECEPAIDEITNEAIVKEANEEILTLGLDGLPKEISEGTKKKITEEFEIILDLVDFNNRGYEIFRRWYIDGRIYYHAMVDVNKISEGIQELRYLDPRKIKKVRELKKDTKDGKTQQSTREEYYIYTEAGYGTQTSNDVSQLNSYQNRQGVKIAKDAIVTSNSGLNDETGKMNISYLNKAIRPLNQLRMLEDASVIYRIVRAPMRRVFYVDTEGMPKAKAEPFVRDMMTKHKNKLVFNSQTGAVQGDRNFQTMMDDYWLPTSGGRGTKIDTLNGDNMADKMETVEYFKDKLFDSLNIPKGRRGAENSIFDIGNSSTITREELKFQKFVNRLRLRFAGFILDALEKQLILKKIIVAEDWAEIKNNLHLNFNKDNYFAELKDQEILIKKANALNLIDPYVGKYYSVEWIKKNLLLMNDEDIEQINKDIKDNPEQNISIQLMQAIHLQQIDNMGDSHQAGLDQETDAASADNDKQAENNK